MSDSHQSLYRENLHLKQRVQDLESQLESDVSSFQEINVANEIYDTIKQRDDLLSRARQQIIKLQAENREQERGKQDIDRQLVLQTNKVQTLQNELAELKSKLIDTKQIYQEVQTKPRYVESLREDSRGESIVLQQRHQEEVLRLGQQIGELRLEKQSLTDNCRQLQQKCDTIQQQLKVALEFEDSERAMRLQLKEQAIQTQKLEGLLAKAEEKINLGQQNTDDKSIQLAQIKEKLLQQQIALKQLLKENEQQEQVIGRLTQQNEKLVEALQANAQEKTSSQMQLESELKAAVEIKRQQQQKDSELSEAKSQINNLQQQIKQSQAAYCDSSEQLVEQRENAQRLNAKLAEREAELMNVNGRADTLQLKITEQQNEILCYSKRIQQYQQEIQQNIERYGSVTVDAQAQRTANLELETKMRLINEQNKITDTKNQQLQEENKALSSKIEQQVSEIQQLGQKISSFTQEKQLSDAAVSNLQQQFNGFKQQWTTETQRVIELLVGTFETELKGKTLLEAVEGVCLVHQELKMLVKKQRDYDEIKDDLVVQKQVANQALEQRQQLKQNVQEYKDKIQRLEDVLAKFKADRKLVDSNIQQEVQQLQQQYKKMIKDFVDKCATKNDIAYINQELIKLQQMVGQ